MAQAEVPNDLSAPNHVKEYLELAAALYAGRLDEDDLPTAVHHLPLPNRQLLDYLADKSLAAGLTQPRYGWAIMAVADAAATYLTDNLFLRSVAACYLAWAGNRWVRPNRVEAAVRRAQAGFAALNEHGWLAACAWQRNALPWTRRDFHLAADELTQALAGLVEAGLDEFVPLCRLSLAYAHLLIGNFSQAAEQIAASEKVFAAHNDQLNLGYCWLTKSSCLRRQSQFAQAMACLKEALDLFQSQGATVYLAMTHFQLAYVIHFLQGDLKAAEVHFQQAAEIFQASDMSLWLAQCYGGLAQIYNETGQLGKAGKALAQARQIYADDEIPGLWADNLFDSGQLEIYRGNYNLSLDYLAQAKALYTEAGNRWMPAVVLLKQGEANAQLGHYEQALQYLEEAHTRLQTLNVPERVVDCERRLAHIWSQLGHPQQAHAYLEKAIHRQRQSGEFNVLPFIYSLQAEILFNEGKKADALTVLQDALVVAQRQGRQPLIGLAHRLLGEAFSASGQLDEAGAHLQAAVATFTAIDMPMELAVCYVAWGYYYAQIGSHEAAETVWRRALALSQDVMPDVAWRVYAGLAMAAEERGDEVAALAQYRLAFQALAQLRQELWQPALAGSFLSRPAYVLNQAVTLAVRAGSGHEALRFIEASKAQTFIRRLCSDNWWPSPATSSPEVVDLAAEIRWLQEKIRVSFNTTWGWLRSPEELALRQQLQQKAEAYDTLTGRIERLHDPGYQSGATFDLGHFRRLAKATLGQAWVALDYYLTGDHLNLVMISPTEVCAWCLDIPDPLRFILETIASPGRSGHSLTGGDLSSLGAWLLPEAIQQKLTTDTTLIIAPHHHLHRLPWAALYLEPAARPLVAACVPAIVPSLHSLILLWQRPLMAPSSPTSGLLVAVASFQGRYPPLPAVTAEAEAIAAHLGPGSRRLQAAEATWLNLRQVGGENGLAPFAFLHVASHAFHDPVTGRLSGLALYDRDLWLDEVAQLAPLPGLVTFSACSGSQSRVYEGDEHVGLVTACLAAGAQSVVGSLWPVEDADTADLMLNFYEQHLAGRRVAHALALAQRQAWRLGSDTAHWGSFRCTGQP